MYKKAGLVTVLCLILLCVGYGRTTSHEVFSTLGKDHALSGEVADTHYNLDRHDNWLRRDELNTAVRQGALSAEWHTADSQDWEKTWNNTWLGVEKQDWEAARSTADATHLRYEVHGSAADCCALVTSLAGSKWHGTAVQLDADCCSVTAERHAAREWEHSTGNQAADCCDEAAPGRSDHAWSYAISDHGADCCAIAARAEIWQKHVSQNKTEHASAWTETLNKEWEADWSAAGSIENLDWSHSEFNVG